MSPLTPFKAPLFICFAPNFWDGQWMNRQQLLSRIGCHYPTLYSQGGWARWSWRDAFKQSTLLGGFAQKNNVTVDSPPAALLNWPALPFYNNAVMSLRGLRLERKIKTLPAHDVRVLYIFNPEYEIYVDTIPHDILVYHSYDNFAAMYHNNSVVNCQEARLCRDADVIVASSQETCDRFARDYGRDDAHFLPNGADFPLFSAPQPEPPAFLSEVMARPGPKVGYVGSVNEKVDFPLLESIVAGSPHFNFVFVGRVNGLNAELRAAWERITSRDNVFTFDSCSKEQVPAILQHMDVNCIYYDVSEGSDQYLK